MIQKFWQILLHINLLCYAIYLCSLFFVYISRLLKKKIFILTKLPKQQSFISHRGSIILGYSPVHGNLSLTLHLTPMLMPTKLESALQRLTPPAVTREAMKMTKIWICSPVNRKTSIWAPDKQVACAVPRSGDFCSLAVDSYSEFIVL